MIVLFSDFGLEGPYIGQVKAALYGSQPEVPVIDLFSDAPVHNPKASAYLLAAYCQSFADNTVFLAVVDPGVGGSRQALVVRAQNRWFVGPDNGLFELVIRNTKKTAQYWEIIWRPQALSSTFHGRDLFAPIAAQIAGDSGTIDDKSCFAPLKSGHIQRPDWPDDLCEIVYIDHFGNAITGIRACQMHRRFGLIAAGKKIPAAETFTCVKAGDMFCYANSNGLVEIAANQGRASDILGMQIGGKIEISGM